MFSCISPNHSLNIFAIQSNLMISLERLELRTAHASRVRYCLGML